MYSKLHPTVCKQPKVHSNSCKDSWVLICYVQTHRLIYFPYSAERYVISLINQTRNVEKSVSSFRTEITRLIVMRAAALRVHCQENRSPQASLHIRTIPFKTPRPRLLFIVLLTQKHKIPLQDHQQDPAPDLFLESPNPTLDLIRVQMAQDLAHHLVLYLRLLLRVVKQVY